MTGEITVTARREERAVCPVCRDPIRPDPERVERCAQCSALYHPSCDPCGECPTCGETQALLRLLDEDVVCAHELPDGTVLRRVAGCRAWVEADPYKVARLYRCREEEGDTYEGRVGHRVDDCAVGCGAVPVLLCAGEKNGPDFSSGGADALLRPVLPSDGRPVHASLSPTWSERDTSLRLGSDGLEMSDPNVIIPRTQRAS